jgi:hypothetical protein
MRCRGVGPSVAKGSETGFLGGDRRERIQQVAGGSRQPVKPRHHQHTSPAASWVSNPRSCGRPAAANMPASPAPEGENVLFPVTINNSYHPSWNVGGQWDEGILEPRHSAARGGGGAHGFTLFPERSIEVGDSQEWMHS